MSTLWHDVRHAARSLAATRGFTYVALVTLALGIGANATIFSLVDAIFLRPLPPPVRDAQAIVHVSETRVGRTELFPLSLPDFAYYRARSRAFAELAAHYPSAPLHLVVGETPRAVVGSVVTASYFRVLGIRPALGRLFVAGEDSLRTRDPVVVIGYRLWQQAFGGAPDAIGRRVAINGTPFTIVGVAPEGFRGVLTGFDASELWLPSATFDVGYRYCDAFARGCDIVQLLGRLAPGVTVARAQAELDVLARQLAAAFPETNRGRGVRVSPARGVFTARAEDQPRPVGVLVGGVAVVLLIACANLSGLLLARGLRRRKEIAVRLALGATRTRLVRQLLTESVVLALAGGALGVALAVWGAELVGSLYGTSDSGIALNFTVAIRWNVVAWTFGLAVLAGLASGLAPALTGGGRRADVQLVMREEGAGGGGGVTRSRLRSALVVSQVALSVVLLVGAGLLLRSMQQLVRGPGFDPRRVVVLRLRPSLVRYDAVKAWAFQREVLRRFSALPGVESASPSEGLPMFDYGFDVSLSLPGAEASRAADTLRVTSGRVGAGYFATLGARLLDGREFTDDDRAGAPPVVIVNDVLAARLWPGARAVGRTVVLDGRPYEVVGVARDVQYHSLAERPTPYLYRSYWQQRDSSGWQQDSRTHVRVRGDARAMLPLLRREVAAIDPAVPVSEDGALVDRVRYTFQPVRLASAALVSFAALALVLSMVGLYGVLAFTVSHRTREIAIRMALGGESGHVIRMIVRFGLQLVAAGLLIGLAISFATNRLLTAQLWNTSPNDPVTFAVVILLITTIGVLACWVPARRAVRVQPMIALRHE
jgi:predicted permease